MLTWQPGHKLKFMMIASGFECEIMFAARFETSGRPTGMGTGTLRPS